MDRTAVDIVLDLVHSGDISKEDAKTLLESINKPPEVVTVTVPYNTNKPDWTYDPNRTGQPWWTITSTGTTMQDKNNTTTNG